MRVVYSEGLHRTLANSQDAAAKWRHRFVHTEHLLIGLLEERSSATSLLKRLGYDREKLRKEVEAQCRKGDSIMEENRKSTPRVQDIMTYAREEREKLGDEKLDTRHMLLGMLIEDGGIAGQTLRNAGLTYEDAFKACQDRAAEKADSAHSEDAVKRTRKKTYTAKPLWRRLLGA